MNRYREALVPLPTFVSLMILSLLPIMSSPSGQILQILRPGKPFYAETIAILGLLLTAFTPLIQLAPPSRLLHAFMLSAHCVMMLLCATTLFADVSLGRGGRFNFRTRHWSQILRTICILSGSLAIISLLSIIKLCVALVSLLVWLLFATHLTSSLIQDLKQPPIASTTINRVANFTSTISESINIVFGMMKNWVTNLFQRCPVAIPVINIRNLFDHRISGTARGMVRLPV